MDASAWSRGSSVSIRAKLRLSSLFEMADLVALQVSAMASSGLGPGEPGGIASSITLLPANGSHDHCRYPLVVACRGHFPPVAQTLSGTEWICWQAGYAGHSCHIPCTMIDHY